MPQPDLSSGMDWISYGEGWLSIFDRPGGRSVLLHTTDAGAHWTRERAATALETIDFFDPRHGVLTSQPVPGQTANPADPAAPVTTTYRSGDGGRHWQTLASPRGAEAQRPSFADDRHGWVWDPSPAGLYATGDGGGHWRRLDALGLPDAGHAPAALGFWDAARGWAVLPDAPGPPALFTTGDGGQTWSARPLPAPAGGWPAGSRFELGPASIAPDGHGELVVSELVPWEFHLVALAHWVAATADAGATWTISERLPDTPPRTVVGVSTGRAIGSGAWAWSAGELLTTRDGGGHWASVPLPPRWSIDRVQAIDATTAWVAANVADGHGSSRWRLFSTRDGGASWSESRLPSLR